MPSPTEVQEEELHVAGDERRRNHQCDRRRRPDPLLLPPRPFLRVLGSRVADRLVRRPDGQPDERLELGDHHALGAAPGVAPNVDAVAVRSLPERQPVGLAAVTDRRRRPEPAPLEADPVRQQLAILIALGPTYCSAMSTPPSPMVCVRSDAMPVLGEP